jgi:hypothetical protein
MRWQCPKCGAPAGGHGKGACQSGDLCEGIICECEDDGFLSDDHGESFSNPCKNANCYHCGWGGTIPLKPRGLQAWEKKALEGGWTPPKERAVQLGLVDGKEKS